MIEQHAASKQAVSANTFYGVVAVWTLALVFTVLIGIFVDEQGRTPWLVLGFAGVVILSFAVQLAYAKPVGYIFRVSASVVGGLIVMGLLSMIFGLAALIP